MISLQIVELIIFSINNIRNEGCGHFVKALYFRQKHLDIEKDY